MKKPILVIMAAGLGSRFGGNKQITPVDEQGQIIIDYSIFDAVHAGFGKVVCVVKPDNKDAFHEAIGARIAEHVDLHYAYQSLDMLPKGFAIPEGRVKPWGTGHAALCAREHLDGPFAVINADDYYGREAYEAMARFLMQNDGENTHAMVGYKVENTLTENGSVSRGVCERNGDLLTEVIERTNIVPQGDGAAYTEDGGQTYTHIERGTIVSMNLWGFMPSAVEKMQAYFEDFLREIMPGNPLKAEFYLPSIPNRMLKEGTGEVRVLPTGERWYGVTYREDLPKVKDAIAQMKAQGKYPEELWRK
ncbi:MAG: NTP transferase domain-containing protein [Eubacteriales bacterium]|nr:NTP transferase domain-containing protein [Eubacteriales bacterium]